MVSPGTSMQSAHCGCFVKCNWRDEQIYEFARKFLRAHDDNDDDEDDNDNVNAVRKF